MKFLLTDPAYRKKIVGQITDNILLDFWNDFEKLKDSEKRQDTSSTLNKVWAFLLEPLVRNCIGQPKNHISFDKIVLVSLPELERENAALLGSLILTQLFIENPKTHLFIDDAERFPESLLTTIMASCSNVSVQIATRRLQEELAASVGTVVAFKCHLKDSVFLEPEFNLGDGEIKPYELQPFKALTAVDGKSTELRMIKHNYPLTPKVRKKFVDRCRSQYTTPRIYVEKKIERFMGVKDES
jgi:hypothetical protein